MLSVRTRLMLAARQKIHKESTAITENHDTNIDNMVLKKEMELQETSSLLKNGQFPDSQISDELKKKISIVMKATFAIVEKKSRSTLDFSDYNLCYGGMRHVLKEIHGWDTTCIIKMDFSGCNLDERGINIVYGIAKLCKYMKELNISKNNIGRSGITWVAKIVQVTKISFLNLAHNGLNDQDIEILLAALPESDSLIDLDLSYNILGPCMGKAMSKFLPTSSLKCLNLSHNEIGSEGARKMLAGLQENDSLEELNLSWNYLYDKGMLPISEAILTVPLLRKISLNGNFITEVGASYIASSLRENSTLEVLEVAQNFIRSQGASSLVRSIRSNLGSKLRVLDINGTLVSHEFITMYRRMQLDKAHFEVMGFCVMLEDKRELSNAS